MTVKNSVIIDKLCNTLHSEHRQARPSCLVLPSISPRASFRAMPPFAAAELVSRGSSRLNIQQSVGSCCASNPLHRHHITPPAHLISHYFIQNAFIINHKEYRSWCNTFQVRFGYHLIRHWMKWTGWSLDKIACPKAKSLPWFSVVHFMRIVR